jgi:hypothetical protein
MKNKTTLIVKYAIVLAVIFLLTSRKVPLAQQFHFVNFTREVFAETSDDKKIYSLDISKLEKIQNELTKDENDITGFPVDILMLHGKKVKITGYLLIPYDAYLTDDKPLDSFAVGKNAYGCPCCDWGNSPPPTIFNTVFVKTKEGLNLSPPFTPLVEVTGTFSAHREYFIDEDGVKQLSGLFFIQDAEAKKWF